MSFELNRENLVQSHAILMKCILVLDYVVVKAQQLFGSHEKMICVCYRYPGSCLSEKSNMQHLQNIASFHFISSKDDLPKIIDLKLVSK